MAATSDLYVKVNADTDQVVKTCRIIAKHLTALADELELARRDPTPEVPA